MTKTKQEQLDEMVQKLEELEKEVVSFALENGLDLCLDGRGDLILEEDHWSGKERGEWWTSTDACS